MQGFTTTVQLPEELNEAIVEAVKTTFIHANEKAVKGKEFPLYLNTKQACEYLNVSYNTLQKFIKSDNNFPYSSVDGVVRFNRNELDKYMLSKK